MTPRVTILTPTIPGREALLAECVASVAAQTMPVLHMSFLDAAREGPAVIRNRLLERVETPYVGFLDDDDLMDPGHVETLVARLDSQVPADLAWSRCRTLFAPGVPWVRVPQPLRPDYKALCRYQRNWIPVTVIARVGAIRAAGGFDPRDRYEDYALWCRMLGAGAVFVYVPVDTWTYRFLGANRTHG